MVADDLAVEAALTCPLGLLEGNILDTNRRRAAMAKMRDISIRLIPEVENSENL